jgi:hypothetical protein
MTGRQKRYWQILATFLLGGAVAGVCYNVVRGHLAPINFATGAIFGLMIASGIGAFEALVAQGPARLWLRSLPLAGAAVVRSLVYAAVIFPIQYYDLGVKVIGLQSIAVSLMLQLAIGRGPKLFDQLRLLLWGLAPEVSKFVRMLVSEFCHHVARDSGGLTAGLWIGHWTFADARGWPGPLKRRLSELSNQAALGRAP